jgi:hypothetical protein
MAVNQAIECVRSDWNVTCPVGQKQAALALMNEVVWLRLQFAAIQGIVNNGVDLPAHERLDQNEWRRFAIERQEPNKE